MKKISWVAIIIAISLSCSKPERITAKEVDDTIRRFDSGWKNKNAKIVDSVLSKQYIYFTQSGGTFSRDNVVQTAGSPDYQLELMERVLISASISGNTAVVNTTWRGKGSYFGDAFDDLQRCSITIIKLNGKVEILSEHCTPLN